MLDRAALLALVDQAARDPSGARRLLDQAGAMVEAALRDGDYTMPPGYIYSGAHTWIAEFGDVAPEPLPVAGATPPTRVPLTGSSNGAVPIEVPFDALILGVSGWASPVIPDDAATNAQVSGLLAMSAQAEGRDLFAVQWDLDGNTHYVTDGRTSLLEPAAVVVGTRTRPRALGWLVHRNDTIDVQVRNLTNVVAPFAWFDQQPEPFGWALDIFVGFHALNLERP